MQLTTCAECGKPAEIDREQILESTNGPVLMARVLCIDGHWYDIHSDAWEVLA